MYNIMTVMGPLNVYDVEFKFLIKIGIQIGVYA